MKLYNTMQRKVVELEIEEGKELSFYTCGPTVYDYPHIGNWYTYVRWDMVHRVLKSQGYKVKWVMNITDVGHLVSDADDGEDKLEKGARREGKTAWEVAQFYTDYFVDNMNVLNITQPDIMCKATDHIPEQIELIQKLEAKGFTYQITDGIYFDSSKDEDYGKLARLDLANLKEGARVEVNPEKKNPTDFALWKFSPKDAKRDMEWESPWGIGFPGWHIECSAMSMKYLGETIDIHAGGIDHIPVHHTNEIAQSESATDKQFVRYWLHGYFNLVDGKKMSKSAGTFLTLEDIKKKGFEPLAFKLLVLDVHYRKEAHFSWENLEAAKTVLQKLRAWADLRFQGLSSEKLANNYKDALELIEDELVSDFQTHNAISVIHGMVNRSAELGADSEAISQAVDKIDELLGLGLGDSEDINEDAKSLLYERSQARDNKDWEKSDELRKQLTLQGIEVKDMDQGQVWSRAA